jgi:LmbE family N-acetylglucosaminyl deacetylase
VRTPRWRLTRRYGPVLVLVLASGVATMNGSAPSSAAPLRVGPTARWTSAGTGDSARGLHDRWRPDRRGNDESTLDGAAAALERDDLAATATGRPAPAGSGWISPAPLPAAAPPARHVLVVLSPHPDDETLSFGVWIADALARGYRVVVVCLTDGRSTGATRTVSARLGRTLTRDEIAAARIRELRQAAAQLGVAPTDVYRAQLDDEATPGGSRVTVAETGEVIRAFAVQFPQATFATMSWTAERQPDHLSAGRALHDAAVQGVVHDARFAVSRLWWNLPAPTVTDVVPASPAVRARVNAAAAAYKLWDPSHQRYSVGWLSVRHQFSALAADPRSRLHGL